MQAAKRLVPAALHPGSFLGTSLPLRKGVQASQLLLAWQLPGRLRLLLCSVVLNGSRGARAERPLLLVRKLQLLVLQLLYLLGSHDSLRTGVLAAVCGKHVPRIAAPTRKCRSPPALPLQLVQPRRQRRLGLRPRGGSKARTGRGGSHEASRPGGEPRGAAGAVQWHVPLDPVHEPLAMHRCPARRHRLLLLRRCMPGLHLRLSRGSARCGAAARRGSWAALCGRQLRTYRLAVLQLLPGGRQRNGAGCLQAR